ncbi:hypothetical protein JL100_029250 [Skermanella mucosa]|uniref:hypothetical protein n=1 Tax=Skermanella mucosa TaxID=1789672 RepID=UPI00192C38CD|nr:hypothetical protein [Skermanella mucosa]UEM21101.1 hypothetical protein JL100_029250 [Skermanella mucosa]
MPTSESYTGRYHAGLNGVRVSDAKGDPVEDAVATIIGDSLSELLDEMDRHGMERESCVF